MYYAAYIRQVERIRGYFSGREETILSKDYMLLLRTRYVFLPAIYALFKQEFPTYTLFHKVKVFSKAKYDLLVAQLEQEDANEKGKALENIAEYVLACSTHLQVMGKRLRTEYGEMDLSCCNISQDSDVWKLGSLILVECKNWKEKVGVQIIRQLGYTMLHKGNITTILFSRSGITEPAKAEILRQAMIGKYILCFDKSEFETFGCKDDFMNMLITKYQFLEEGTANAIDLIGV